MKFEERKYFIREEAYFNVVKYGRVSKNKLERKREEAKGSAIRDVSYWHEAVSEWSADNEG